MRFKEPFFGFFQNEKAIAVVQAANKRVARGRAQLVSHIVAIPPRCSVRQVPSGSMFRAPVFFEGHFRALEEAISEANQECASW